MMRDRRERRREGRPTDRLIPIRQAARGASSRPYQLPQVPVANGAALGPDRSATLHLFSTDICQGGASYRVTVTSGIICTYTMLSRELSIETNKETELRAFEGPIEW